MKHIIAISVLMLMVTGLFAQVTPPKKTFYFQKNAQLPVAPPDTMVDPQITPGKNLVFFYEWQSAKNPQIADADRTDKVYFELTPKAAKRFTALNQDLGKAKLIHCRLCFCLKGGCWTSIEGELTVKKTGRDKYAVKFRVDPESEKYLVNETFTPKK